MDDDDLPFGDGYVSTALPMAGLSEEDAELAQTDAEFRRRHGMREGFGVDWDN